MTVRRELFAQLEERLGIGKMSIRVRFAPSPTGYLHVGGARTALFNWLFARRSGGRFVLRIEDTDQQRSQEEMVSVILRSLEQLGIDWDEGPFYQSERMEIYKSACTRLLEKGRAYYDFSEPGSGPASFRSFRNLPLEEARKKIDGGISPAVRFKVPEAGTIKINDLIFGRVEVAASEIEDFVIARSGGVPTYHLSVVADDIDMQISHIIRGADHLPNTSKHLLLFEALEYPVPVFAHLPLILGKDRKRLSKRHGAASVTAYLAEGMLPQALRNYLALLGWSPGGDREMISLEEMVELFDLDRVNRANAVFDPAKLEWMNKQYLSSLPAEELFAPVRDVLLGAGSYRPEFEEKEKEYFCRVIDLIKSRVNSLNDFAEYGRPYLGDDYSFEEEAWERHLGRELLKPDDPRLLGLARFRAACADPQTSFDLETTEKVLRGIASDLDLKAGVLIGLVRLAMTGRAQAPGIFDVLVTLGREKTVARLDRLLERARGSS